MLWLVLLCAATCGTSAGPPDDVSWLPLPPLPYAQDSPDKTSYTERLVDGWHNRSRNATRGPTDGDTKYPDDLDLVSNFLLNNIGDLRRPEVAEGVHKTWPGDSSVESLDDLILYHTYTSGARPDFKPGTLTPRPTNQKPTLQHTPGGTVGFIKQPVNTLSGWQSVSHKPQRPSVILVEDVRPPYHDPWPHKPHPSPPVTPFTLLTHRPFLEHSTRPTPSLEPPQIVIINHYPTGDPTTARPPYSTYKPLPATTTFHPYPPPYQDDFTTTHKPRPDDHTTTHQSPVSSTHRPPPEGSKCPNITINNHNVHNASKEGCGDINIVINNANLLIKDTSTELPSPGVQGDPLPPLADPVDEFPEEEPSPSPPGGIVGMMTPVMDAMNNLTPAMSVFAAPMLLFLAFGLGLTGLIFPWALSSALWRRSHGKGGVTHHYWTHKDKGHGGWGRDEDRRFVRERVRGREQFKKTNLGVNGKERERGLDSNDNWELMEELEELVIGVMTAFESVTREEERQ